MKIKRYIFKKFCALLNNPDWSDTGKDYLEKEISKIEDTEKAINLLKVNRYIVNNKGVLCWTYEGIKKFSDLISPNNMLRGK